MRTGTGSMLTRTLMKLYYMPGINLYTIGNSRIPTPYMFWERFRVSEGGVNRFVECSRPICSVLWSKSTQKS